jgi:hypothetical protein
MSRFAMPKATNCVLNGRVIDVQTALEMRARKASPNFRCCRCGESVRAHKEGTTGQAAHFEHLAANDRCELSNLK